MALERINMTERSQSASKAFMRPRPAEMTRRMSRWLANNCQCQLQAWTVSYDGEALRGTMASREDIEMLWRRAGPALFPNMHPKMGAPTMWRSFKYLRALRHCQ